MATLLYVAHVLCVVVWVGGMVFAMAVLRPAAHAALEGPQRLALMEGVFRRFFRLLWHVVPLVLLSGWGMLFGWYWGFGASIWHVHLMHTTGLVMAGIFVFVALVPWRRMRAALAAGNGPAAAAALDTIRKGVLVNMVIGLATVAVATWGRFGG
ncbi:CopD family protein [Neoroseomonas lacus]|uniref:Copper resistance protein D domain-containing protein n=1 Tax=Neoroseomonas lacus TaxID=287609 RepID=A0A917NG70_9PROT|nr:CopD family protein [Neoroseomonas lacus]GGI98109.1 hypothetical protein GCM10011320_01090 [Neoroseomonas lacus]